MRAFLVRCAAVAALCTLGGCYHYVPAARVELRRGTPIRVRLVGPVSFELPSVTAHNVGGLTGELVREDPSDLVLSATRLDAVTGGSFDGHSWTFTIARNEVIGLEARKVSVWRTASVLIGGALATWLGFDALRGSDATGGPPGSGGETR